MHKTTDVENVDRNVYQRKKAINVLEKTDRDKNDLFIERHVLQENS